MDQITAELFPPSQIPYPVIFARILGALFLGAVIGFEREAKARPAGLKTHMLVCLAACTFGIISLESVRLGGFFDDRVRLDPLRVVEAVTAGVAFLAAGTIVLSRVKFRDNDWRQPVARGGHRSCGGLRSVGCCRFCSCLRLLCPLRHRLHRGAGHAPPKAGRRTTGRGEQYPGQALGLTFTRFDRAPGHLEKLSICMS